LLLSLKEDSMGRIKPVWAVLLAMLLCGVASAITINGVTFVRSTMTISGVGFNGTLTVTLSGKKLTIVSSTPTQIVATIPTVPDTGSYRLIVNAGKASTFAYVTVPLPTILTGGCSSANWVVGQYVTIWLIGDGGDQSCRSGYHYPPYNGVLVAYGGVLKNLTVTGQFAGTATVYVNYVPTALSCTVTTYPPNPYAIGCGDTIDRPQINAGDAVDVGLTPSVSQMNNVQATLQFQ
jgi:IPT/TIG domain